MGIGFMVHLLKKTGHQAAKEKGAKEKTASASVSVITGASGERLPSDSVRSRVDEIRTWVADHMGALFARRYVYYKMQCTLDLRKRGMLDARKFLLWEKVYCERAVLRNRFMQRIDEIITWVADHMGQLPTTWANFQLPHGPIGCSALKTCITPNKIILININ